MHLLDRWPPTCLDSAWTLALIASLLGAISNAGAAHQASGSLLARMRATRETRTEVAELAERLTDSIGPRLVGSPALDAAHDWLAATYTAWGIDVRRESIGTWRGWKRGPSHIDLETPRAQSLDGTMLGFSPGTDGKHVTAPVVILPRFRDSSELVRWLPAARGKAVLVSAGLPTCRTPADWEKFATTPSALAMDSAMAREQREWRDVNSGEESGGLRGSGYAIGRGTGPLAKRLEAAGAAAVVLSQPKLTFRVPNGRFAAMAGMFENVGPNGHGGRAAVEIAETNTATMPVVSLSCESYGMLFRLAERNQSPSIRLNLTASFLGERPQFNTIATIRGRELPNEYVILSAHLDSWDGAAGATDNATGTVAMMEAAHILRSVVRNPRRTILIGHWSGEEKGEIGSAAFRDAHPEVVRGTQIVLNQDNGTGRIVSISGGGIPDEEPHVLRWLERLPSDLRSQITYEGLGAPGGSSDDNSFACAGVPTLPLMGKSWDYIDDTWHSNRDTYDKIVIDDLASNASLIALIAYLAADDPASIQHVDPAAAKPSTPGSALRSWPSCSTPPRSTRIR